jgi:putative FmdB family regulatory protein
MPIYEYVCRACGHHFEHLLLPAAASAPACPECESADLEKLMSGFALSTSDLTKSRVKAARKQFAQSKNTKDKQIAEAEYVQHHMEDHVPPPATPRRKAR